MFCSYNYVTGMMCSRGGKKRTAKFFMKFGSKSAWEFTRNSEFGSSKVPASSPKAQEATFSMTYL